MDKRANGGKSGEATMGERLGAPVERAWAALDRGDAAALREAVLAGAPTLERDAHGHSMLAAAVRVGRPACAAELVALGADAYGEEPNGEHAARMACQEGDLSTLRAMLGAGLEMRPSAPGSWGEARALELLLELGADPDGRDREGRTPLMRVRRGASGALCAKALLRWGADPNLADAEGLTALMWAAPDFDRKASLAATMRGVEDQAVAIMRALLDGGADPTLRGNDGKTALDICGAGFDEVARTLRAGVAAWEARQLDAATAPGSPRGGAPRM